MVDLGTDTQMVNAVGGGDLNHELILEELAADLDMPIVEYEPETSPMLKLKFDKSSPTIILFRTGSYFIAGAKSTEELRLTFNKLNEKLTHALQNFDDNETTFEVRNLVFQWLTDEEFDLSMLAVGLGLENVEYNPEVFPAIIYAIDDTNGKLIIYRTGCVTLMGVSEYEEANECFNTIEREFENLGININ
jgi:transcription initiation factor TFIID TATA-box-binding protein